MEATTSAITSSSTLPSASWACSRHSRSIVWVLLRSFWALSRRLAAQLEILARDGDLLLLVEALDVLLEVP